MTAPKLKAISGGRRYPTNGDAWEDALRWRTAITTSGEIVKTLEATLANVYAILRNAPEWDGVIVYNDARGETQMAAPPPFAEDARAEERLSLAMRVKIVIWLERTWSLKVNTKMVGEAVEAIARSRTINPVAAYLNGLKWDGVPRLDRWLTTYAGAADTDYTRGVGAAWLRQGVARALNPGCPFYGMLVLEGHQGKGKSSLFGILGGDYFTDDLLDLHSKDAVAQVRRSWIVELPELSAVRRSDIEFTKAFLTRRIDTQRLAYREDPEAMARRCIFGGSTNGDAWLVDTTGNRRFWPVAIRKGATVDLEGLARDRDQLWAEAVATWKAGAPANLPPELWGAAAEVQSERVMDDVWEGAVSRYLTNKKQVTAEGVLVDGLGLKLEQVGHRDRLRIGDVLRKMGWLRRLVRSVRDGKSVREWVFEPDIDPPETCHQPPPVTNPPVTSDNPGKTGLVTNVTNLSGDEDHPASPKSSYYPIGDIGDIGDNRVNIGVSGVTNPVPTPPQGQGIGDSPTDAWDARYHEHLAAAPGHISRAYEATMAELGPRPEEVPDV